MLRLLILLAFVTCMPANAKGTDKSKIEFCNPDMIRDGRHYRLGYSVFVEGESTADGKTIFPTNSDFSKPITHIFEFPSEKKGSFWIGCTYNSKTDTFIENIEIKTKPARCVEVMSAEIVNQVQSITCESKKASP